ncbi:MAG: glycerol-3-phosphate 1-O-acyltransferase PlsY [Myxococcaceae bacterium]
MAGALVVLGYLSGSIPFGVILTRAVKGVDVRTQGSGNIGATNVTRVAGRRVGAVVLLLDAAKGALPVLAARLLLPGEPRVHAAVALAAFLGHVFPVWLKLRGGKGVATALGALLVLVPWAALAGLAVYAVLFVLLRTSSIGSLAGGGVTVVTAFLVSREGEYAILTAALFGMMVFTHRANIARILRRAERRF